MRIVLLNDKKLERDAMMRALASASYHAEGTGDEQAALAALARESPQVVVFCAPPRGAPNFPPQADDIGICTPQSVNGMCCASEATGFCSCRQWSCENDSLGCSCGSNTDGPLKKCTGAFGVCCMTVIGTASNCYCDDLLTECVGANDVKVANCDIAIAPCGQGETEVDACKP